MFKIIRTTNDKIEFVDLLTRTTAPGPEAYAYAYTYAGEYSGQQVKR